MPVERETQEYEPYVYKLEPHNAILSGEHMKTVSTENNREVII